MAQFRVGCVPYVNARPLVAVFDQPNEFVDVLYDVPSKLPAMLESGKVDAILVSSVELLRRDDLWPASTVGIMSNGPVQSVRLLSKVPVGQIKSLALDQSSMTSNMLAQVLLAEQDVFPTLDNLPPDGPNMLKDHDACVLIGDRGYEADGTGLVDIDLGQAWTEMTGLPFVWALWLGPIASQVLTNILGYAFAASGFASLHRLIDTPQDSARPHELEALRAVSESEQYRRDFVIRSAMSRSSWTCDQVESYLAHGVRFSSHRDNEALAKFAELMTKHGLCEAKQPHQEFFVGLHQEILDLVPQPVQR